MIRCNGKFLTYFEFDDKYFDDVTAPFKFESMSNSYRIQYQNEKSAVSKVIKFLKNQKIKYKPRHQGKGTGSMISIL